MDTIKITNARVHNLKSVSLEIPKNKLVVITGLSGSGKSSLAFDTIYAEGQRRYAESLNAYARQFMDMADKPDVDEYLRLLFSRIGTQYCPNCKTAVATHTSGAIVERIRALARTQEIILAAPIIHQEKISLKNLKNRLERADVERVLINNVEVSLKSLVKFSFHDSQVYDVSVIIATIKNNSKTTLASLVEKALELGNGHCVIITADKEEKIFSTKPVCSTCSRIFLPIEPRSFSFNSPYGACSRCTGLGVTLEVDPDLVIPNARLTLAEGAVQPWTRLVGNQQFYQDLLEQVAAKNNFSTHIPVESLSKRA